MWVCCSITAWLIFADICLFVDYLPCSACAKLANISSMNTATLTANNASIPVVNNVPLRQDAQVMGLVGLAHCSSHFSHMLLSPLFPIFIQDFGLSFTQIGLLTTVFFTVSGMGQATAGFVVDRFGARPVLFGSLCLFVVACLIAANATSYPWLIAVSVMAGLGNCAFHPVDFTIMNQRVSAPRLGYAFSFHGITGNLGWALATAFFVGITALSDWHVAYYSAAAMMLLVLATMVINRDKLRTDVVRGVGVVGADGVHAAGSGLAFLKLPVVWWCFGFFLLSTMTLAVIQSFSVSILKALHGVSFEVASTTITAYMLCGALGMLVGGVVAARYPAYSDKVVAICMAVAAAFLAVCATGWLGGLGTMVVLAATGFAVGIGGPSRDMMIKKATPKGATGRVYGTVYSGLDVGFALSPIVFGQLMDRGWYSATLLGAAVVLLLSVGAAIGVGRRTVQSV